MQYTTTEMAETNPDVLAMLNLPENETSLSPMGQNAPAPNVQTSIVSPNIPVQGVAESDQAILKKLNDAWAADNVSPHDLVNKVAYEGLSGQDVDPFDWKKMTLGMATSVAASIPEGAKGYKWGQKLTQTLPNRGWLGAVKATTPVVTGALRGAAASAAALGSTEFTYDVVDDLVSGKEFDPAAAYDSAWDAAQTDFLFSSAGGLGLPVVAKTYRVAKEGTGALKGMLPKRTPIAGKAGLGDKSIVQIEKLQKELVEMGGSLLPSMVTDKAVPKFLEQIAKVSKFTRGTVENYFNIYGQFMGKQIDEMVSMFGTTDPRKQGQVLTAFINQNDAALRQIVDPLYKALDIKGKGVTVDVRKRAAALADEISQSGPYRAQPKVNKEGVLVPQTTASGKTAAVLKDLRSMPDDLNFFEAHQKLSTIKGDLADLRASTNPDSKLATVLRQQQELIEEGMEESAKRLSPSLQKEYQEVTDYYSRGRKVVGATWLKSALKQSDPATVGRILTQDGLSEGLIQIKDLRKIAAQFKADLPKPSKGASNKEVAEYKAMLKGLDADPLEGIRRGYLDELLRTNPDDSLSSATLFANKLKQPRFRATFNELFAGTSVPVKIDEILENLMILSRSDKSQQGFALTIAGAEQQVLTDPKVNVMFKSFLPAFFASRQVSAKSMDKLINLQKVAIASQQRGVKLPPAFYKSFESLVGTGNIMGTTLTAGDN
tara:strand:+ start:3533 stop:5677 length:2145 start_codon:yes stop_codon:yes gene_type:complete